MATTFSLSLEVSGIIDGREMRFGRYHSPYSVTATADNTYYEKQICESETTTQVVVLPLEAGNPTFIMLIPSVDGNFWYSANGLANNSSLLGWKAGVPLIFPNGKSTEYGTGSARAAATSSFIDNIYFYVTGEDDGYVEVFYVL